MIYDSDRLHQLLTKPALRRVLDRLRRRLQHGRSLDSAITLSDLSSEERSAIDHVLGRLPSLGAAVSVQPREFERILREAQLCDSLEEALIHVLGPVTNERHAKESARQLWADLRASIMSEFVGLPTYHSWLDRIFAGGQLKRLCKNDCRVGARFMLGVASALRGIPWPVLSLTDLATRLTGDSHALDRGTPLSRLCLSAIESQRTVGDSNSSRRQLWEWAGVVIDELSVPVLVLSLRADPATLIGRMLHTLADAGEPCHLSVRLLRSAGVIAFEKMNGQIAYACENPSVVATAAQRLGRACPPLICTAGQPASAAQLLLSLLKQAGCRVLYHGDFDNAGIGISNLLIERFGVEPWRMTTADYAIARIKGPPLGAKCVTASWDEQLAQLINARGHSVLEESVLDVLLDDLSQAELPDAPEDGYSRAGIMP